MNHVAILATHRLDLEGLLQHAERQGGDRDADEEAAPPTERAVDDQAALTEDVGEDRRQVAHRRGQVIRPLRVSRNGTFAAPLTFPTQRGPATVVAGDFNRDGVPDIATGNQSDSYDAFCDGSTLLSDSVSILLQDRASR